MKQEGCLHQEIYIVRQRALTAIDPVSSAGVIAPADPERLDTEPARELEEPDLRPPFPTDIGIAKPDPDPWLQGFRGSCDGLRGPGEDPLFARILPAAAPAASRTLLRDEPREDELNLEGPGPVGLLSSWGEYRVAEDTGGSGAM